MPTIEIICLEQTEPTPFPRLPFALESENTLMPHRGLFWADYQLQHGCIYHLANPDMRDDKSGGFFASALIDWDSWDAVGPILRFQPKFIPSLRNLLENLMTASPRRKLMFITDYQFGGRTRRPKRPLTLKKFWEKHDAEKLRFNALYWLVP